MLLFKRLALLILPLWLTACGFTPVYAPGGTGSVLRGQVSVAPPDDGTSFVLVQELEQRLGRGGGRFDLTFDLALSEEGLAITRTGDITRFNMIGQVSYELTDLTNNQIVAAGQVDNFTAYSATGSTVETLAAERDARERLMRVLADQITAQLFATADLPAS